MPLLQIQGLPANLPEIPADSVMVQKITGDIKKISQMTPDELGEWALEGTIQFGLKLAAIVVIYIVGRWLIRKIDKFIRRVLTLRRVDPSVNSFVRNIVKAIGYTIVLMIMVQVLGVRTTWFMAFLAAAGFAIGMTLSGTLQNFAGGIIILVFKPFRTGDYVLIQGQEGTVKEIKFFGTVLITSDNHRVVVPNGSVISNVIDNISTEGTRRVEWKFAINYGADFSKAKAILERFLRQDKRIMDEPKFQIVIQDITGSTIYIIVRAWVNHPDYSDVYYALNENVYTTFPTEGLGLPVQRMDVALLNDAAQTDGRDTDGQK